MMTSHINKLKDLYNNVTSSKCKNDLKEYNNFKQYLCEGYPEWLVNSYVYDIEHGNI